MILCSLKLENFKRYKEFEIEFFEGLTGLIGQNGSGKSTIFDAIFFALYGELKNKNAKSFVRYVNSSDKDVVLVELVFEIAAAQYKVRREFRGKSLVAKAYVYDSSETLLASGSKEVDKKIKNLIGMEKTAFLNTVFASQKELTSLSKLDNEERKKLIRKLLGLEKIDGVEKRIRENLTNLRRDTKSYLELLLKADIEKQINDDVKKIKNDLKQKQKEIIERTNEYKDITFEYENIYKQLQMFQKQKEHLSLLQKELSLIEQQISNNSEQIKKSTLHLEDLKIKQKEYKEKQSIKVMFKELEISLQQQNQYKENHLKQEGLLKEQKRLRIEFKRVREEIHDLNVEVKDIPQYRKKLEDLIVQIGTVQKAIVEIEKIEREYSNEIAALNSLITQHKNKVEALKKLGKESNCPTCTRPLLNEYDNVLKALNHEINGIYVQKIENLSIKLNEQVEKKEKTIQYKEELEKSKNELNSSLKLFDDKFKRLQVQKNILEDIGKVGRKNNEDLAKIKEVCYDRILYNSLLEQHKVARIEYEMVLKLEESIQNIPKQKKDLEFLQDCDVKFTEQKLSALHLIKEDTYDAKEDNNKELEYKKTAVKKEEIQTQLRVSEKLFEQYNGNLKALSQRLTQNEKHKLKLQNKQDDINDYEKLKVNLTEFKTKINAKIAPRISQIASLMYSNITKGKYQHIEVTNDFDFNIYDEGKAYPIERFSGGEIDLANLVLRIAISKTLSELSGVKQVGFLAFDEVFGSQDEKRREEIMNAFLTIKEEYRQIFLISHETEIKELFEYFVEIK